MLLLYCAASWALEPFIGLVLGQRLKRGKERAARAPERLGRTTHVRPGGPLLWMHGASVGEAGLLLDVFAALKRRRPELIGLLTTQTLTSADMAAARAQDGVIHQMAPVDGPRATARFWTYWRPEAGLLAEGEIWPNLLLGAKRRNIPLVLANARMTEKSRTSWRNRKRSANTLFSVFEFIGAADQDTADALEEVLDRPVNVVGNLKRAIPAPSVDATQLEAWRKALGDRHVLLAASTHESEEALALKAFSAFQTARPDIEARLIIAPRHPDRADEVETEIRAAGHTFQR
ncbi:MAG: glycosyltransferase N-terminal domain-containing protein, partial [Pseudomonadota bacterium]